MFGFACSLHADTSEKPPHNPNFVRFVGGNRTFHVNRNFAKPSGTIAFSLARFYCIMKSMHTLLSNTALSTGMSGMHVQLRILLYLIFQLK